MSVEFRPYSDESLPSIVAHWNRAFADRRNFFPVTERTFRERVIDKRTEIERFDPALYWVAAEGNEVVGIVHGAVRPEALCRLLVPEWPGGTQGIITFLHVLPSHRGRGIGSELWRRIHAALGGVKQVALDGQCINPFYGNSEGPFTPFWGTPEGISVAWEDSETKKFFARRGFAPRFKAVQLELAVRSARTEPADLPVVEIRVSDDFYPELGVTYRSTARYRKGGPYSCAAAVVSGKTVGVLGWYPLVEVGAGRFAIYEAIVSQDFKGKGIGKALLATAIARMRETGAERCDVLTIPELGDAAYRLYVSTGFTPCANWAIY